ncbi:MAG: cold shock domain-containing protein [Paraglaciecola sp.]|nr:cold shock domain-containing protein [Paraglaciecola sp.]NCT48025.1 cold shock domain-containing protein [Paraglaciecola sp.]
MTKGQIKSWHAAKGFGFIKSPDLENEVFVHIRAFARGSREPQVGDVIYFDVVTQPDGKVRATDCYFAGQAKPVKSVSVYKPTT